MRRRASATVQLSKPIHPDDDPSGRPPIVRRNEEAGPSGHAPTYNDDHPTVDTLGPIRTEHPEILDALQRG